MLKSITVIYTAIQGLEKQTRNPGSFAPVPLAPFLCFPCLHLDQGDDGETWELTREDLDADERIGLGWGTRFDPSNTGGEIRVQQEILQG